MRNSPYEVPRQHWELDFEGQPTGEIAERRRWAEPMRSSVRPPTRRAAPTETAFATDRTSLLEAKRSDLPSACGDDLRERGESRRVQSGVDPIGTRIGEIRSDGPEGIASWSIDTDDNEESFVVRDAYFLGANDPDKALKTTLKAEIDEEAWSTLHSDPLRPFAKSTSGPIAVKVSNHLGDEVMKVFRVG